MKHFIQLNVASGAAGVQRWFRVRRDIAEFYGWTEGYDVAGETEPGAPVERSFRTMPTTAFRPDIGGRKIRISRSPRRDHYPAGMVNQFRISRTCNNTDLAELARLTTADWSWMETAHGQIWTRDEWLDQP